MKQKIFSIVSFIVGIGIFIAAINIIGIDLIIEQFKTIEPIHIAIYLLVSMILVCTLIYKWQLVLKAMGYKIKFKDLFMYRQMSYAVGYVVPSFYIGAQTLKGLFLKKLFRNQMYELYLLLQLNALSGAAPCRILFL